MKYIVNMLLIMTSSVFLACSSNTITKAQIDNVCTQTTAIEKGVRLTNLMCSGNYDKALVLLDTLLEIDPNSPNYCFCQGWCYDMLGDSLKAKKVICKQRNYIINIMFFTMRHRLHFPKRTLHYV